MKHLIAAASLMIVTLAADISLAGGCSKSGGGGNWIRPIRPVYPPVHKIQPPVHHHPPHHHVSKPKCVIRPPREVAPAPIAPAPAPTPAPVTPPPAPVQRPEFESGQTVTIDGRFFGPRTGSVDVLIGGLHLDAAVINWSSTQAKAVLPQLPLSGPVDGSVIVRSATRKIVAQLYITLLPAQQPVVGTPTPGTPAPAPQLPVVSPGQQVTLDAANLGQTAGQVMISIGGLKLNATVNTWSSVQVTASLPALQIAEAVQARIELVTSSGQVANHVDVMLSPATNTIALR